MPQKCYSENQYTLKECSFHHIRKKIWEFFTSITFNLDPVCCLHSVHLIFECLQSSVTYLWWVPSTAHNMLLFKSCTDMTSPLHMLHRKLCPLFKSEDPWGHEMGTPFTVHLPGKVLSQHFWMILPKNCGAHSCWNVTCEFTPLYSSSILRLGVLLMISYAKKKKLAMC